ncbi:DNA adenine methylase [uncultured Methanobrevibacter sp.]|uniref:DNA adenine methylase n=1 Tax=uncultured Methanobrevibacter sp. TaxID=253161 RepID=UPI0026047E4E|nr:DNA adenine methylase [uncultured Methanobrevibacter sp.]
MQTIKEFDIDAKPFLKWAGGKSKLINEIELRFPKFIKESGKIEKYFEPFIGGGALFFYLMSNYDVSESYIYDINSELIVVYKTIQNNPHELIDLLSEIKERFIPKDHEDRKEFYLNIRKSFNEKLYDFDFENYSQEFIERAAQIIFMNKTCFNGLFRVNKKGEFNVPFGKYKNPSIFDAENIIAASVALKNTKIINASFLESEQFIDENSLVYLDPPYRPLSKSSNFTSYSKFDFTDDDQIELAKYYKRISSSGAKVILSNSDPKNTDETDNFFDDLYGDFVIDRVKAPRMINCNGNKRKPVNEIIVRNY